MADTATLIASWFTPSSLFIFVNLVIGTIAITSRFGAPKRQIHEPQLVRSPSLLDRVRSFNLRHYNHGEPTFVEQAESSQPQLVRTPSLLDRVRSFNLRQNNHGEPTFVEQAESTQPQLVRTPSLLDRVGSFNLRQNNHCEPTFVEQAESTQPQLVRTPSLLERVRSFNLSLYKHQPTQAETDCVRPEPEPENPTPNPENPQLVRTPSLLQRVQSMSFSRLYRSDSLHREQEDPDTKPGRGSGKAEMKKSASEKAGSAKYEWEEDEETVERRRPATVTAGRETREDEEVDAKADDFINRFKKQLRLQRMDSLLRYREIIRGN